MRKILIVLVGLMPFVIFPPSVSAHAFGQIFTLALPLWMYLYGAGIALVVSFLFIGYFMSQRSVRGFYPTDDISHWIPIRVATSKPAHMLLQSISIFLFFLTVVSGLVGTDIAYLNFSMTFFWIIWLLGLTYLSIIFGNIYELINPWKILTEWFEGITRTNVNAARQYPIRLSYWPAVFFFFCFIWIELLGDTTPFALSVFLLVYTLITLSGILLFGKNNWFTYGEFFSVYFGLLSKGSLLIREGRHTLLRIPFLGLHKEKAGHIALLSFILIMLGSTAFDGFRESDAWLAVFYDVLRPINLFLGQSSYSVMQTVGLFLAPLLFFGLYFMGMLCMKKITKTQLSLGSLLLAFAYTLVPIGLVYNFAHYFTLLFVQGQAIIPLLSDPFGWGWNLFGTAGYVVNIGILDAQVIWNMQVYAIVIGHIAGVYLSHVTSLSLFTDHKKALLSQIPMLALMVIYTITGLWILSQSAV